MHADVTFKGEEDDDTKKWLEEIDNLFYEAEQHKVSYTKPSRKELEPKVGGTLKLEINFSGEIKILYELIGSSKPSDYHKALVSTAYNDVKQQYARCKDVQAKLIDLLDTETAESEMKWAKHIQSIYVDVNRNIMTYYNKIQETEEKWVKKTTGLKLEPMRMPQFSGEIRDYLRFKSDFQRQVIPVMSTSDSATYALMSCLDKGSQRIVKNIDDNLDEMWKRLYENYGQPSKLADIIMHEIKLSC